MNTFSGSTNSATIQITGAGARQSIACSLENMKGKRLALTAGQRVPPFTPVHIECDDKLFLGEVLACTHNVDDTWHLEVKVEQILTGLQSLITLRARLLGEPVPDVMPAFAARR